jgi:predicted secreted protein
VAPRRARRPGPAPKSLPPASGVPSTATRAAAKLRATSASAARAASPSAVTVASIPHQSAERKAIRSRSRSTTIRVATLWTRPAERPLVLRRMTSDSLKP